MTADIDCQILPRANAVFLLAASTGGFAQRCARNLLWAWSCRPRRGTGALFRDRLHRSAWTGVHPRHPVVAREPLPDVAPHRRRNSCPVGHGQSGVLAALRRRGHAGRRLCHDSAAWVLCGVAVVCGEPGSSGARPSARAMIAQTGFSSRRSAASRRSSRSSSSCVNFIRGSAPAVPARRRRLKAHSATPPRPGPAAAAATAAAYSGSAGFEQDELAVARDQEIDHLAVTVSGRDPLAHQQPQVARQRRIGIVDRLVLAHHAAQFARQVARTRFLERGPA